MVTLELIVSEKTEGQTDKKTYKQTNKQTNKQTDKRRQNDYSRRATITNMTDYPIVAEGAYNNVTKFCT